MSIQIKVERELDDEFVSDVLVTAFDGSYGGCWYWADSKRVDENQGPWGYVSEEEGADWAFVNITLQQGDDTGNKVLDAMMQKGVRVDGEAIRVGIQRIMDGDVGVSDDIRNHIVRGVLEGDAGEIDAIGADCIVQAGVFGELIYG